MAAQAKAKRKVRIGGTIDSDVADWLGRTKGKEKFSKHLNVILRSVMESGAGAQPSLESFQIKLDNILDRVKQLQDKVECIEPGRASAVPAKRPRGRPRKIDTAVGRKTGGKRAAAGTGYDVRDDVQWFLSHDRYGKVRAEPLINAFEMVQRKLETGDNLTVGMLKEDYDTSAIGVPYPTFRLFYFPLIRDRMLEKKIIEKVEKPGKKGVYRKR